MTGIITAFVGGSYADAPIPPGQQAYITPGTYTWVVPAGVRTVSVVAISGGAGPRVEGDAGSTGGNSSFGPVSGTTYLVNGASNNFGGYNGNFTSGFDGGSGNGSDANEGVGAGGAAGYAGNGGSGNSGNLAGANGNGGGGGGGAGNTSGAGGSGGGVGILGQGSSGTGGTAGGGNGNGGSGGANGSSSGGGAYGGGGGSASGSGARRIGGGGGGLGYINNLTVSPGDSITVVVGAGGPARSGTRVGAGGAVRIIWAGTRPGDVSRAFPSTNTGDL